MCTLPVHAHVMHSGYPGEHASLGAGPASSLSRTAAHWQGALALGPDGSSIALPQIERHNLRTRLRMIDAILRQLERCMHGNLELDPRPQIPGTLSEADAARGAGRALWPPSAAPAPYVMIFDPENASLEV